MGFALVFIAVLCIAFPPLGFGLLGVILLLKLTRGLNGKGGSGTWAQRLEADQWARSAPRSNNPEDYRS